MDSQKFPTDLLARAYLDMLATEAGTNSSPLLRSGNPDDPIERLIDDLSRPQSPPVGHRYEPTLQLLQSWSPARLSQ